MSAVAALEAAPAGRCACGKPIVKNGMCEDCARRRGQLQRTAIDAREGGVAPAAVHDTLGGAGAPLAPRVRASMEPLFGRDFSSVRVHTGPAAERSAAAVGADAYTVGSSVVFGRDRYRPERVRGRALLAHELAHVVQQDGARRAGPIDVQPAGTPLEGEADRAGARAAAGAPAGPISRGAPAAVQRGQAGGCVVPSKTDGQVGEDVHKVIQGWCASQHAPCRGEEPIPGGGEGGGTGEADLFYEPPKSRETEIGEIKPITQRFSSAPWEQLENYIQAYKVYSTGRDVKAMYSWLPGPPNGEYPFPSPTSKQFLTCSASTDGVYFYWCTKTKRRRNKPERVDISDELRKDLKNKLKKIRDDWKTSHEGDPQKEPQEDPHPPPPIPPITPGPRGPDKPAGPESPVDEPEGGHEPVDEPPQGHRPPYRPPKPPPQPWLSPRDIVKLLLVVAAVAIVVALGGAVLGTLAALGRFLLAVGAALAALFFGTHEASAGGGGGGGSAGGAGGAGGQAGAGGEGGGASGEAPEAKGQEPGKGGTGEKPGTGEHGGTSEHAGSQPGPGPSGGSDAGDALDDVGEAGGGPPPKPEVAHEAAKEGRKVTDAASKGGGDPASDEAAQTAKDIQGDVAEAEKQTGEAKGKQGTGTGTGKAKPKEGTESGTGKAKPKQGTESGEGLRDMGRQPIQIPAGHITAKTSVGDQFDAVVTVLRGERPRVPMKFVVTAVAGGVVTLALREGWTVKLRSGQIIGSDAGAEYQWTLPRERRR